MPSTYQKGNTAELELKKLLEAQGWLVDRAGAKLKRFGGQVRTQKHDYFGLFDLICIDPNGQVVFIQVKTNRSNASSWFTKLNQASPALLQQEIWCCLRLSREEAVKKGYKAQKWGLWEIRKYQEKKWASMVMITTLPV